ncbi:MAG: MucB/RseB C-terminal domain-containing protein [Casimicrobiaceae bacterium]
MRAHSRSASERRGWPTRLCRGAGIAAAALLVVPAAFGQDAAEWLQRAAAAARQLNYAGTIVYQHGGRIETSRLYHLQDASGESEKLSNLDGPAREIVRNDDQVRCYYPDAKVMRVESRRMHNAFPSVLPQQLATLATYYYFRKGEITRIAGLEAQAYVFEPKDAARYGHKLWADIATGLLLKARLLNERNEPVEQFAFSDIQIGVRLDRDATKPPFETVPSDWQVRESPGPDIAAKETGWVVRDMPPGFTKIVEGYRTLRGKAAQVAHIVFSDGLVAISVFVEPTPATPQPVGLSQQGGINVYSRQLDDYLVTVLGEAPGATVRQIAYSVGRRQ